MRLSSISIVFALALFGCGGDGSSGGSTGGAGGKGGAGGSSGSGGSGGSGGSVATGGSGGSGGGSGGVSPGSCDPDPLKTGLVAEQTGVSADIADCSILKWTAQYAEPDPMIVKAMIYGESRF